jgi:hypothetical protein
VDRRDALCVVGGALLAACGAPAKAPTANAGGTGERAPTPLRVAHAADLAAAAGLTWLVEARLRELFANADLIPALHLLIREARLDKFAARNGGVDPRQVKEVVAAQYGSDSLLVVATGLFDPVKLEATFAERAAPLDGRAIDRANAPDGSPLVPVARLWGTIRSERQQLAILGREALALEQGRFGPLRAAEAFAQGKLKRARPALDSVPLARTSELLGDAPLRMFAPGPFEGAWALGLGGLLKASTAAAIGVRVVAPAPAQATAAGAADTGAGSGATPKVRLACTLVLTGGWGTSAPAAGERLGAAFDRLAQESLGHLCGLDRPLEGPRVKTTSDALTLEVALDPLEMARGLRAATEASVEEIMSY